jgi:predicted nucleic acid-binding protein
VPSELPEPSAPPERGPAYVCFDATQLFAFNRVDRLDTLGDWFPKAFVPNVVIEKEVRPFVRKYPKNQRILSATWLHSVAVESDSGLRLVAHLRDRVWKSPPEKDRGEAEVLALCRDYGWIAILDDEQARVAAERHAKAPRAMLLTIIIAAAAYEKISRNDAWKLHVDIDKARKKMGIGSRSFLTSDLCHEGVFAKCIDMFGGFRDKFDNPEWPTFLAIPSLDELVDWVRRNN